MYRGMSSIGVCNSSWAASVGVTSNNNGSVYRSVWLVCMGGVRLVGIVWGRFYCR